MRQLLFGILFVFVVSISKASTNSCAAVFHPQSWMQLPDVQKAPWPVRFHSALQQHAIVQKLKSLYGDGNELTFYLGDLTEDTVTGWAIQASFVQKILIDIFPRAHFAKSILSTPGGVGIHFGDDALLLGRLDTSVDPFQDFDMTILKAANPGPPSISRNELREQMKLPQNARIASLYLGKIATDEGVEHSIQEIFAKGNVDIVIASEQHTYVRSAFRTDSDLKQSLRSQGIEVVTSSEWITLHPDKNKKYLIANETRSRLPYIHGASDFVVILGSANIFEPINMGTAVFYFPTSEMKRPYFNERFGGWDFITGVASKSGSAHAVTMENIGHTLQSFQTPAQVTPIYETEIGASSKAIDLILEKLENLIDLQKGGKKLKGYW